MVQSIYHARFADLIDFLTALHGERDPPATLVSKIGAARGKQTDMTYDPSTATVDGGLAGIGARPHRKSAFS